MDQVLSSLLRCGVVCSALAGGAAWGQAHDQAVPRQAPPAGQDQPPLRPEQQRMHESGHKQVPSRRQPAKTEQGKEGGAAGTDARDSRTQPGSTTGSTGHGGMQVAGASAGSGGTPDLRE